MALKSGVKMIENKRQKRPRKQYYSFSLSLEESDYDAFFLEYIEKIFRVHRKKNIGKKEERE